ncbi:MAG: AAA family ATPase [Gallionella sp.]|nr:AAA family ATPase [Gallionella sp.]
MKIKQLQIENFRGIESLPLVFHENVNVIAGVNGCGKSSVIDCLAVLLSRFTCRVKSEHGAGGRVFSVADIRNGVSKTQNTITITLDDSGDVTWFVIRDRYSSTTPSAQRISNLEQIKAITNSLREKIKTDASCNIPIAVYYPTNRAVLDIPLRIKGKHIFDQHEAIDNALNGQSSNFRLFFEWFRNREDIENEERINNSRKRDRQLECVRRAIYKLVPNFSDIKIKRTPLRMVLKKNKTEISVNQLSDGEKCLLAMVGDLARRLALANPGLADPLEGEGVVLIDEIELHLHPTWQRRIVSSLSETFKNCQFIVSTHSPLVLSQVKPECINIIKSSADGKIIALQPKFSYGRNTERLLEDLMETQDRPDDVHLMLGQLFLEIENNNFKKARSLISKLKNLIGDDPELVKAEALIVRRELLGK